MGDTNSIARLLDQLSSSTAWQQAVSVSTQVANAEPASSPVAPSREETPSKSLQLEKSTQIIDEDEPLVEAPSSQVSALLDLLGDTTVPSKDHKTSIISEYGDGTVGSTTILAPPDTNLRYASFAEALQAVTKLGQRPTVIKHLKEIRDEQNRLEQRYWESRQQLLEKQRKSIEELKTKYAIFGNSPA